MFLTPLFFLWNPPSIWWVMAAYALAANGPCLIAQRYNRIRLQGALKRRDSFESPRRVVTPSPY
jgi:glycosyl-4,4'-diaponeurosporenoate acyltransferase